ncbi:MAG TPA: hypothetical protein VD735_05250 [Candidatus Saccharimonadales bacterium]|nr:hypothetical protein [Candidatus Saccharimonadales bacterium]
MDSLQDLLGKYSPKEPPEILAIKKYIQEHFNAPSSIGMQGETAIVITVHSASLANTLRYHVPKLRAVCNGTKKRFLFRIG